MGYMNQYIAAYMNLKIRLYQELAMNHSHPDRIFQVNWISHYNNPESSLRLKDITIRKQSEF